MSGEMRETAARLCESARASGARTLLEPDAFDLLAAAGLDTPRRLFVRGSVEAAGLDSAALGSARVVVKVVAPGIAHKSDVGGVVFVPNEPDAIAGAVRRMEEIFAGQEVAGYSVSEAIPFDPALGGEWLLGLRWLDEFGPVITIGPGGVTAEFLSDVIQPGRNLAVLAPARATRAQLEAAVSRLAITPLATGGVRRQPARTTLEALCTAAERFATLAGVCAPGLLGEIEINPLVTSPNGLVALDVLAVLATPVLPRVAPRPVRKLAHLLTPRHIAVAGVSTRRNAGRVILENLEREGFPRDAVHVIKPGVTEIAGYPAVPDIRSLPHPVDLLVLSVAADQVPDALVEVVESQRAESVIVIPGGLEEKAGSEPIVERMYAAIAASRETAWGGPLVNGGNCLGIQSRPGRYDTMFIPGHKLGAEVGEDAPLAFISQSGAFAVSRVTRLAGLRPRYTVTVGNQMDLTIGDYLRAIGEDPEVHIVALYVEGFRPLDGAATLDAIERFTAGGRTVIAYRAGRTREGAEATASHTASVAGDYIVTRELLRQAGALVADTLDDFTDLVELFTRLESRRVWGTRLGIISNAGFECVAAADSLAGFTRASLSSGTVARLHAILDHARISGLVDVHNPLDVTPMLGDEGFEEAVRAMLDDPHVDLAVVGCVPATPALNTLAASAAHGEDTAAAGSIASRLVRLHRDTAKPWVAVVDAGSLYDPFARQLQAGGIPTFRAIDRALRLFALYASVRMPHTLGAASERYVDVFDQAAGGAPATEAERTAARPAMR